MTNTRYTHDHEQCIFPRYGITQYTKIRLQEYDRIYARIWYMITNIVDSDNKPMHILTGMMPDGDPTWEIQ